MVEISHAAASGSHRLPRHLDNNLNSIFISYLETTHTTTLVLCLYLIIHHG
jgi:hypothetical protein